MDDVRSHRDQLKKHFREEMKSKSEIQRIERDIENQVLSLQNKKAELNSVIAEKGQGNIQVKIINEEIDEVNQKIGGFKVKLQEEQRRFSDLEGQRDDFKRSWTKDKSVKEMHVEVLSALMKE